MSKQDNYIKYSQGVLLCGFKDESGMEGLLTTYGFADAAAKYETFEDILYFKKYRNAIFQILPESNFELNDEWREHAEDKGGILRERAKSQKVQFELKMASKKRQLVYFGDTVVFQHVDSQNYLSGTLRPSQGFNGAFVVEGIPHLSQRLLFKILPSRSYERLGMPIEKDAPILIRNIFNNGYLTCERSTHQPKPSSGLKILVKTTSASQQTHECVTHARNLSSDSSQPMPWKMILHADEIENDILIQHDIIYLQHTLNNGVLSAVGTQIALKQPTEPGVQELIFYDCLWEIEKYEEDPALKNRYILRHLMSGMVFGVKEGNVSVPNGNDGPQEVIENIASRPHFIDIANRPVQHIELRLAKKQNDIINSGSLINICYEGECLDVDQQEFNFNDDFETDTTYFDTGVIRRSAREEINYKVKTLAFTAQITKNCFLVREIPDNLKKQVLFALSFHSKILDLRQDLRQSLQEAEQRVHYLRMMQMIEKIKEILQFLKKTTGEVREFVCPCPHRQMICAHLGVGQLLLELLREMRKKIEPSTKDKGEYIFMKENKVNEKEKYMELYNTIYDVLCELVRGSTLLKVQMSSWVNFILEDVLNDNHPSQLRLLLELLHENWFLVAFVEADLVIKLTQRMFGPKTSMEFHERKYLEIFRKMCVVGKRVNVDNQLIITTHFLQALKNEPCYFIPILKDGEVWTEAAIDKSEVRKRKFMDYYKRCADERRSAWLYFVQYLYLVGDLSLARNPSIQQMLEPMFPLQTLADLLEMEALHEAEVPFLRIVLNLYAESELYYPIERDNCICLYKSLQDTPSIMTTTSESKPWMSTFKRILKYLEGRLKHFALQGPISALNSADGVLREVLLATKETLHLGFWEHYSNLQFIAEQVMEMVSIVDYSQGDSSEVEPPQMVDSTNKVNCLFLATEIIELLLDYQEDLDVKIICGHFKTTLLSQSSKTYNTSTEVVEFIKGIPQGKSIFNECLLDQIMKLSQLNNSQLTNIVMCIMDRILQRRTMAMTRFQRTIWVVDEEQVSLVQYIEERKNKFQILLDVTLANGIDLKTPTGKCIYNEDIKSGLMQDMHLLSELALQENTVRNLSDIKSLKTSGLILGADRLLNFTCERMTNGIVKQRLLSGENMHLKVLLFIRNCKKVPSKGLAKELLHLCYKYLTLLAWNYPPIKKKLIAELPNMRNHIGENVGCIDLIRQLYDNNKGLLYNESEVLKLASQICSCIKKPIEEPYRAKLMDFFRFLIYFNERCLKANQIRILKIVQDDTYCEIIPKITDKTLEYQIKIYEEQNKSTRIKMTPRLLYFVSYFQLLISVIDDDNQVNMGKLRKKYPFVELVKWIRLSKGCWALKRNIRCFLNRLYYLQPQIQTYINTIVEKQIDNIIWDLDAFIKSKYKPSPTDIYLDPVRFTYCSSYAYLNLEEVLLTLKVITDNKEERDKLGREMKGILHPKEGVQIERPYKFIRICERLALIRGYFISCENIYTTSFIRCLLHSLKQTLNDFDDSVYVKGMTMSKAVTKKEKEADREKLIDKIMRGDIKGYYLEENNVSLLSELPLVFSSEDKFISKPEQRTTNQEEIKNKLKAILTKEKILFQNQNQQFVWRIEQLSAQMEGVEAKKIFSTHYYELLQQRAEGVHIFKFIKVIVEMNSKSQCGLNKEEKIFFVQLITELVRLKNRQSDKEIDEWDADDWKHCKEAINSLQQKLQQCKLGTFLTDLLREDIASTIDLADSILLCAIAYLLGGYTATQIDVIKAIENDPQNRVMRNIECLITKMGKLILKNNQKIQQHDLQTFKVNTRDNYDFFDKRHMYVTRRAVFQKQSAQERKERIFCISTYQRAFRLLQLLCENSNEEGKRLVKDQVNGLVKVNFIYVVVRELQALFTSLNEETAKIALFLLDFLIQVTQIPIKANQEALLRLNFFQILCTINQNQQQQSYLQEIYFKGIQIILSLFQGNQLFIFQCIDDKVKPRFLLSILKNLLKGLNISNKQAAEEYIENQKCFVFDSDNEITQVLNIIIIFEKMRQKMVKEHGLQSKLYASYQKLKQTDEYEQLLTYLQRCLLSIQITDSLNVTQKVLFPKHPIYSMLMKSGNLRDSVMNSVVRSTHREKMVSLLGYKTVLRQKTEESFVLQKQYEITEDNMNEVFNASALASFMICIYMLVFYDVVTEEGMSQYVAKPAVALFRLILAFTQLSLTLVYAYYWWRFKMWEQPQRKPSENKAQVSAEAKNNNNSIINTLNNVVSSPLFYRLAFYLAVSVIGTFYSPMIFFLHILDIFCYVPELGNIFRAIAIKIKELMWVSFMGVAFMFVFSTVTFNNYRKDVYAEDKELCESIMDCNLILGVSGVVGETMNTFQLTRFIYDTVYAVFFGILFSNIISGIILSAFEQLRQILNTLEEDKTNKCYICEVSREQLQKKNLQFKEHIKEKHFLWNYMCYIYALQKKDPTDFSGLEYEISKKYQRPDEQIDISWIPSNSPEPLDPSQELNNFRSLIGKKIQSLKSTKQKLQQRLEASIKPIE